jgi:uncharacterized delta-60 repeat protein
MSKYSLMAKSGGLIVFGLLAAFPAAPSLFSQTATPTLSLSTEALRVNEASGTAIITVSRSGDTNSSIAFSFSTQEGTALADSDFVPATGTITFAPGETNKTVSIGLLEDAVAEPEKNFTIQFSASADIGWSGPRQTSVLIEDNDHPGGVDSSNPLPKDPNFSSLADPFAMGIHRIALGPQGETAFAGTNAANAFYVSFEASRTIRPAIFFSVDSVSSVAFDKRGGVLISGSFPNPIGTPGPISFRRLGPVYDDFQFNSRAAVKGTVNQVLPGADFTVLLAGNFTIGTNPSAHALGRFTDNGALIEDVNPSLFENTEVTAIALDAEKLYAAFIKTNLEKPEYKLARLNAAGALDDEFPTVAADGRIDRIFVQTDHRILALGVFTTVNSNPGSNLVRLNFNGTVDPSFSLPPSNGRISAAAIQNDGRIVVAGTFSEMNGIARQKIARLNSDGSLDSSFDAGSGPTGEIYDLALEPAGTLLVAGDFRSFSGLERSAVIRLKSSVETAFVYWSQQEFSAFERQGYAELTLKRSGNLVQSTRLHVVTSDLTAGITDYTPIDQEIVLEPGESEKQIRVNLSGDHLIEGDELFKVTATQTDSPGSALTRSEAAVRIVDADTPGALDSAFKPDFHLGISAVAVQSSGKILIAYYPTSLLRLNADGSVDTSFSAKLPLPLVNGFSNPTIQTLLPLSGGKFYAAGNFSSSFSSGTNHLVRFNEDGSYDPTFYAGLRGDSTGPARGITALALAGDDSLYIAGDAGLFVSGASYKTVAHLSPSGILDLSFKDRFIQFSSPTAVAVAENGQVLLAGSLRNASLPGGAAGLVRLNPNGDLDLSFAPLPDSSVRALLVQRDKYLVAGDIPFDGEPARRGLARLNPDGTSDTSFSPQIDGPVEGIVPTLDGKLLIYGQFTRVNGARRVMMARLNADGTLDSSFDIGKGFDGSPNAVALQSDGKVLVRGGFYNVDGVFVPYFARLLDQRNPGELRFSSSTYIATEGEAILIKVERTGGSEGSLEARIQTHDLSAIAGADYESLDMLVRFQDGESGEKSFTIPVSHNPAAQGNTTFEVDLSGGPSQEALVARVLIRDAEAGSLDKNYVLKVDPPTGGVTAFDFLSDGSLLLGGGFAAINGIPSRNVARLKTDGTIDPTFLAGLSPNAAVTAVLVEPTGGILLGGLFASLGPEPSRKLARINADGTIDKTFAKNVSSLPVPPSAIIEGLALQDLNKIVVKPEFIRLRLNADGTLEPNSVANVARLLALKDGSIIQAETGMTKLLPDLTVDKSFSVVLGSRPGSTPRVEQLTLGNNGKILFCGDFTTVNGVPRTKAAILEPNGSLDLSFNYEEVGTNAVTAIFQLNNGDVLLGGYPRTFSSTQAAPPWLMRLDSTGKPKPSLAVTMQGKTSMIKRISSDSSGAIYILGRITNVNGITVPGFARIFNTPDRVPVVEIVSPTNKANMPSGSELLVNVKAFDPDGFLSQVRLLLNGAPVSTNTAPPYKFSLADLAEGAITLTAEAVDESGATTASSPITLTISKEDQPLRIESPTIRQDGKLHIVLTGQNGRTYRLETSEDLHGWDPVETRTAGAEALDFPIDPQEKPHRFYRVLQL